MSKIKLSTLLHTSAGINEDTLKLLMIHPGFWKRVTKLREKYSIPTNGFKLEQNESTSVEGDLSDDDLNSSFYSKEEISETEKLLKTLKLKGISTFHERDSIERSIVEQSANTTWENDLNDLLAWLDLADHFRESIRDLILFGQYLSVPNNFSILTRINEPNRVEIVLYGPIPDQEKKKILMFAEHIGKLKASRGWGRWPYQNIDRDIKIAAFTEQKRKQENGENAPSDVEEENDFAIKDDVDIAARIFDDIGELDEDTSIKDFDKKNAIRVRKARSRIKKALLDRFPQETFTT